MSLGQFLLAFFMLIFSVSMQRTLEFIQITDKMRALFQAHKRPKHMQITQNAVVILDYTLKDEEGDMIDESKEASFAYLHGANNIIRGLESALEGKQAGDNVQVVVQPEDAYGDVNPEAIAVVGKETFPEGTELEVGMQFHAESESGQPMEIMITSIDGDEIVIDGNHPLAGEVLHFNVNVIEVREATKEEIEHGHVHGQGGHQH